MSLRSSRAVLVLVLPLLASCKEGVVDLDGGSSFDDAGGMHADAALDAGRDAATAEPDASEPDAGGGGEPDAGGSGPDPALARLAEDLASATCRALEDCVGDRGLLVELLGGRDCVEVTASELRNGELSLLSDSIATDRVVLDSSEREACLADVTALGCDVRSRRWPASCELMLLGTVESGGECSIDQDCAGDAFCDSEDVCPGSCTPLLGDGATCANGDDDQCQDGLICAAATDTCTALGANGDDCGAGVPPCAPGLVCFDDGSGAQCTGLAVVYFRALDESCNPGGACEPGVGVCGDAELCEPGLVCESASSGGVCRPPTAERGGDCKRAVPNQCRPEQVCDAAAPGETGICVDRPKGGEPCIDRSPRCAPGHVCVGDTCVELLDNGQACDDDAQCHGGSCSEGVCAGAALCPG